MSICTGGMSTGLIWTISGDLATGFPVKEYSVCSNLQLKDFLLTFFKTLFDLFFSALRFFRRQIHRRVCSEVARVVWRVGEGGARDLEQVSLWISERSSCAAAVLLF